MNTSLLVQYVVIGVVVLASALYAFRKMAPQLTSRWLASASIHFNQPGHAAWVRSLARRVQPKKSTGDCSDSCSTCGACGPKPPAGARGDAMPLEFRPRSCDPAGTKSQLFYSDEHAGISSQPPLQRAGEAVDH